ncbi:MAG: hypothetical protein LBH25_13915 [Fibromonadaceae bacterium]|nr:hypothetical protein [Fibromonadaceae bacterium]
MKLFKAFLTVTLVTAVGVWAQKVWDGKTDSEWYWENEQKTEFTISTAAQLAGLAQLINGGNNFSGKTIKLTANIMLNDTANWKKWTEDKSKPANSWTPIGSYTDKNNSRSFSGTFDGGGKVISGVYINNSNHYQGLFGYVTSNAAIKNLGIAASYVNGYSIVGGLVGQNNGTVTDCYAVGNVTASGGYKGGIYVGGLAGSNSGTITNSYATGNVSGDDNVGGLVGKNENGTITDSYATGDVKGNSGTVGGLVGENEGGTITNSYAKGNVNGGAAGGLVGENGSHGKPNGTITNSYATGKVSGEYSTGGLVGSNYGTIKDCYATGNVSGKTTGGLVGGNEGGTIIDCYATGNVNGGTAGGLVGKNGDWGNKESKSIIENSYAMGNVRGDTYSNSGGGLVGYNSGTITNSYATGSVWNSGEYGAGGLAGYNSGTITNSYAAGNVSGKTTGGLVGNSEGGTIMNSYAMGNVAGSISGGLVGKLENGYSEKGTIENSYSAGIVTGTASSNGGLVGENGKGTVTSSYYDRQASGQSDVVNKGEPKSTAQMKQQAIFSGWDFSKVWRIDEKNNGYPYLQSSEKSLPVKYKYSGKVQRGDVLTDKRDGKKYKTVIINTQTWMAENLNYNAKSSKCYGEGDKRTPAKEVQTNCTKYGRLYDWKTAINACPSGWHLPTSKEWEELDSYADMYLDGAGKYLKATSGWYKGSVDHNGTDDFGFAALPSGVSSYNSGSGYGGVWWSSSSNETNGDLAYHQSIYYNYQFEIYNNNYKSSLWSVRCLQD